MTASPGPRTLVTARPGAGIARHTARRVWRQLLSFMLPIACVACGSPVTTSAHDTGEIICGRCWAAVPWLPHPRCERCGHPLQLGVASSAARCSWCDLLPPYVRACRSACWVPDGAGGEIVRALKYRGWARAADAIGARVGALDWPDDVIAERRAAIPVPLGRGRLRERGYNQASLIGRSAAEQWGIPVWDDVLTRSRATRAQARLTPGDRLTNVAGAFRVADGVHARVRGAHLILVDDVVTTAATLNACAAALVAGGARVVSYATFGRAWS